MAHKTYAEQNGKAKFNWNKFLSKRTYTPQELAKANSAAGDWVTCACGNLCDIIPRDGSGTPQDEVLGILGREFSIDIAQLKRLRNKQALPTFKIARLQAKNTLQLIELRSQGILDKMAVPKKRK